MKALFVKGVELLIRVLRWINGQGPLPVRNSETNRKNYSFQHKNLVEGILKLQANSKPNPQVREFLAPKKYKAKDLLAEIQRQRQEIKVEG